MLASATVRVQVCGCPPPVGDSSRHRQSRMRASTAIARRRRVVHSMARVTWTRHGQLMANSWPTTKPHATTPARDRGPEQAFRVFRVERTTGFEPATLTLAKDLVSVRDVLVRGATGSAVLGVVRGVCSCPSDRRPVYRPGIEGHRRSIGEHPAPNTLRPWPSRLVRSTSMRCVATCARPLMTTCR